MVVGVGDGLHLRAGVVQLHLHGVLRDEERPVRDPALGQAGKQGEDLLLERLETPRPWSVLAGRQGAQGLAEPFRGLELVAGIGFREPRERHGPAIADPAFG